MSEIAQKFGKTTLRRLLDSLYDAAGAVAAACMVGLLVMVLLSVAGRQFGFHVRGTDAYAGYLMAASGFLALAHTLKRGEHIRVTLLLSKLQGLPARLAGLWALAASLLLAGLAAFYSCRLVWQSKQFNDISTGNDATALWIPQLSMAVGMVVLVVALADELVLHARGHQADVPDGEALHNE